MEEESFGQKAKAVGLIGLLSVYEFFDGLTFGSANRVEESIDDYRDGKIDGIELGLKLTRDVGVGTVAVLANVATGGQLTTILGTGTRGVVASGAALGITSTFTNDVVRMGYGEQDGFSSPETYATSAAAGAALGWVFSKAIGAGKPSSQSSVSHSSSGKPPTGNTKVIKESRTTTNASGKQVTASPKPPQVRERVLQALKESKQARDTSKFSRYANREKAHARLENTRRINRESNFKKYAQNEAEHLRSSAPDPSKKGPGSWVKKNESLGTGADYQARLVPNRVGETYRVNYSNPRPRGRQYIDFDDFDAVSNRLVDVKKSVRTTRKSVNQAQRQMMAAQEHGVGVVWRVPSHAQRLRAEAFFRRKGISGIDVEVFE